MVMFISVDAVNMLEVTDIRARSEAGGISAYVSSSDDELKVTAGWLLCPFTSTCPMPDDELPEHDMYSWYAPHLYGHEKP